MEIPKTDGDYLVVTEAQLRQYMDALYNDANSALPFEHKQALGSVVDFFVVRFLR